MSESGDHRVTLTRQSDKPIHATTDRALQPYQRAPTLITGSEPGAQGQVRVWGPSRRHLQLILAFQIALLLVYLATVLSSWHMLPQVILASLGVYAWILLTVRALKDPRFVSADDAGISFSTTTGTLSLRWSEITELQRLDSRSNLKLSFLGNDLLRHTLDLYGYSPRVRTEILERICQKAQLVRHPRNRKRFLRIESQAALAGPERALCRSGIQFEGWGSLRIASVEPGSPASIAGIAKGDRITEINGERCSSLRASLSWEDELSGPPGSSVQIVCRNREGRYHSLRLQLGSRTNLGAGREPALAAELSAHEPQQP